MAAQPAVVFTRDPEASKLVAAQHQAAFRAAIVEAVPPEFKIPVSKGALMPSVTEAGWKTLAALPIGGLQKISAYSFCTPIASIGPPIGRTMGSKVL